MNKENIEKLTPLQKRIKAREYGLKKGASFRRGMRASIRGSEIGLGFVAGALIGNYLDQKYGWEPWGVLIGISLGLAHAVKMISVIIKDYNARTNYLQNLEEEQEKLETASTDELK